MKRVIGEARQSRGLIKSESLCDLNFTFISRKNGL